MASLRRFPRSPFWFACFTAPDGRRLQRSTKETGRKAAQAKADQWEAFSKERAKAKQAHRVIADIYRMAHNEALPMSTARAFFDGWLARRKHEVKPATFVAYEARARHFLGWLGDKAAQPLSEIAVTDIQRYRDSEAKRVSAQTVNIAIKIMRIMFEDARRDNLVADNPAKDVRTLKAKDAASTRRPFAPAELRAILSVADDEWRSIIIFGIYTGQRLGDIAKLTWANVDYAANEIRLRTSKNGRVVNIPITSPLRNHLETLPAGDNPRAPVHPRAFAVMERQGRVGMLSRQFGEILTDAGLAQVRTHGSMGKGRNARRATSELSFHCLRHTATSLMKNAGASSAVVEDIIGHNSAEMSAHYTHIDSAAKRKALDAMPDVTQAKIKAPTRPRSSRRRKAESASTGRRVRRR